MAAERPGPKAGRPIRPVRAAGGRSPGVIAAFVIVGVFATAVIGYGIYALTRHSDTKPSTSEIAGVVDYRATNPAMLTRNHVQGTVNYPVTPPVGGDHHQVWQNCQGTVYGKAIADENAVHSLEHGAVWITYRPELPAGQVERLAAKVRGTPYLLMSPYSGLDQPISLQAWGYQLKVGSADDPRIDQFVRAYRINAAPEPGAPCSGGPS